MEPRLNIHSNNQTISQHIYTTDECNYRLSPCLTDEKYYISSEKEHTVSFEYMFSVIPPLPSSLLEFDELVQLDQPEHDNRILYDISEQSLDLNTLITDHNKHTNLISQSTMSLDSDTEASGPSSRTYLYSNTSNHESISTTSECEFNPIIPSKKDLEPSVCPKSKYQSIANKHKRQTQYDRDKEYQKSRNQSAQECRRRHTMYVCSLEARVIQLEALIFNLTGKHAAHTPARDIASPWARFRRRGKTQ